MDLTTLEILEKLSSIYEDLDIDSVEERFVSLVDELFDFDRIAFFYIKHTKQMLQGKLGRHFPEGVISSLTYPLSESNCFTMPLKTEAPVVYTQKPLEFNGVVTALNLSNFALIPISFQKNTPCWEMKQCTDTQCPAYGVMHVRCWMITGTSCCDKNDDVTDGTPKLARCCNCSVFSARNIDDVEGILLVDNSTSGNLISRAHLTALSIIGQTVARAVYNAKLFQRVLNDAIRDPLTNLHNRRHFNERLLDEMERTKRYGGSFALILCDIDRFKDVNDQHGHLVGDRVLCWITDTLKTICRHSDVVARFGGEEFIILQLNATRESAHLFAEKLRLHFEENHFRHGGEALAITLSFGVAAASQDTPTTAHDLLDTADKALYTAKREGRNRVVSL